MSPRRSVTALAVMLSTESGRVQNAPPAVDLPNPYQTTDR
jgi:hypothetical protein